MSSIKIKRFELKKFSIIEIAVVLFVILLLMAISAHFYKSVQRSILNKNQFSEFEAIKIGINAFKGGIRGTRKPSTKHVSIYDLVYTHSLLTEKRILLRNGVDKTGGIPDEDGKNGNKVKILSYFDTPIEVYVTKQKNGATQADIDAGLKKIIGHEYLTGDFEFYTGNDHEVDGGESGPGPIGTPWGLKGNGTIDDGHQYFYEFRYKEPDDGVEHRYRFH